MKSMNEMNLNTETKASIKLVWTGWGITILISLLFIMSGVMKLTGGQQVTEGMAVFGFAESILLPLAILELTCVVIYVVPVTSVLGAVLLTGYLGGAICTHMRVGDPFYVPIIIGLLVWLGIYLREKRLWALLPLRK